MITLLDSIKVPSSTYLLSLTTLVGKEIRDIQFYISSELEEHCIKVRRLVFEDGSEMVFEGEHDFPYLVNLDRDQPNTDSQTLECLFEEIEHTIP
jgi:hypothetical protein